MACYAILCKGKIRSLHLNDNSYYKYCNFATTVIQTAVITFLQTPGQC